MGLDDYRNVIKEAQARAAGPQKPEGPTLDKTLGNADDSRLLAELLQMDGREDIAEKLFGHTKLEEGDLAEIKDIHNYFTEQMRSAKEIGETLDDETVIALAGQAGFLKDQLDLGGPKKIADVFRKQLRVLSIRDPHRFEDIKQAHERMVSFHDGQYAAVGQRVEEMCAAWGIDEKRFYDVMRNIDPKDRVNALRAELKAAGFWFTKGKAKALDKRGLTRRTLNDNLQHMDRLIQQTGALLGASIEENEDLREAFMREVRGEKDPRKPEASFKESRADMITERQALEEWDKEKESAAYKALPDAATRQLHLDQWYNQRLERHTKTAEDKGGGLWAEIGISLMNNLFSNARPRFAL